jgi:hypothetical protein
VSLGAPVRPLLLGAKAKIGGLALNTLKKLKGAKLGLPSLLIVEAKQMGRGPILPIKNWCSCGIGVSDGLITSILIIERLSYVPF